MPSFFAWLYFTILVLLSFLTEIQEDIQVFHFKCGKETAHIPAAGF